MASLKVFDPAMCCSTGVCGPEVDPALARFAADLEWLKRQGAEVVRYNLGQEPNAFAAERLVRGALQTGGVESLPLILVDGEIVSRGQYPAREQLAAWLGLAAQAMESGTTGSEGCCGAGLARPGSHGGSCC